MTLQEALEPLFLLSSRHQIFLVTQLPVDSDPLEAAVMALLDGAGVFADGRCDLGASGDVLLHGVWPQRNVPTARPVGACGQRRAGQYW